MKKKSEVKRYTPLEAACADALVERLVAESREVIVMGDQYSPRVMLSPPSFLDALKDACAREGLRFKGFWVGPKKIRFKKGVKVLKMGAKP